MILVIKCPDVLLDLTLADEQILNSALDLIKMRLQFMLDGGIGLLDGLDIVVLVLPVDDAFGADALALAVEAEIEDILIRVLPALLARRDAGHHARRGVIIQLRGGVVVLAGRRALVHLARFLLLHHLRCHALEAVVAVGLGVGEGLDRGLLGGHDELLELADALGVERGAFVADLADDALSVGWGTLAVFFFFI